MSTVEEVYHRAWGALGGAARLRRTSSLFAEMWRMLEFQVKKEHPGLGDREIRRLTANRMYLSDAFAQLLLGLPRREDAMEHDLKETLKRVLDILSQLGLRFHLTGDLASSYYGDPRFTQESHRLEAGQARSAYSNSPFQPGSMRRMSEASSRLRMPHFR